MEKINFKYHAIADEPFILSRNINCRDIKKLEYKINCMVCKSIWFSSHEIELKRHCPKCRPEIYVDYNVLRCFNKEEI